MRLTALSHIEGMFRVDEAGNVHPMPLAPVSSETYAEHESLGHPALSAEGWEVAEQQLIHQFEVGHWPESTYRVAYRVDVLDEIRQISLTMDRKLPLHPAYAELPYRYDPSRKHLPTRGFINRLVRVYPGSSIELVTDNLDTFGAHFGVALSSSDLESATGYRLPADAVRVLSRYSRYRRVEDIPAHLR
jgi:hypothetical protein